MKVLFLNVSSNNGSESETYRYGTRLFSILQRSHSNTYVYAEISTVVGYINECKNVAPNVIIYNYENSWFGWLNSSTIVKTNCKNIGIHNGIDFPDGLFDIMISTNPNEKEAVNKIGIPRPIFEDWETIASFSAVNSKTKQDFIDYNEGSDVPIFGSFGFGSANNGFNKVIYLINSQYDSAIIKILVQPKDEDDYNKIVQVCNAIRKKPGIKLMMINESFTDAEILKFLSSNTCNVFLYDRLEKRQISSCLDYAISANKPFGISDSFWFRHIYNDNISVYKTQINKVIENSTVALKLLKKEFSNENLIRTVDKIVDYSHTGSSLPIENVTAYYYSENYNESGNVTKVVRNILSLYLFNNVSSFVAGNDLFGDTIPFVEKKLYINISDKNGTKQLVYNENDTVDLAKIVESISKDISIDTSKDTGKVNYEQEDNNENITLVVDDVNRLNENTRKVLDIFKNLKLSVKFGDVVDRYSILCIKLKHTTNQEELADITQEMDKLKSMVSLLDNSPMYKMLYYVNEQIWNDKNVIYSMNFENSSSHKKIQYAEIAHRIFTNNQLRFHIKRNFNNVYSSSIETKTYGYEKTSCLVSMNNYTLNDIILKSAEINYLCISYDLVYFDPLIKEVISMLFDHPNIRFIEDQCQMMDSTVVCNLDAYSVNSDIQNILGIRK